MSTTSFKSRAQDAAVAIENEIYDHFSLRGLVGSFPKMYRSPWGEQYGAAQGIASAVTQNNPDSLDALGNQLESILRKHDGMLGVSNEKYPQIMRDRLDGELKSLAGRTADRIIENIEENIRDGATVDRLAAEAFEVFWKDAQHTLDAARDQLEKFKQYDALKNSAASGNVFKFIVQGDSCPACSAHEGETYTLDEIVQGDIFPPLHPNCKCRLAPTDDAREAADGASEFDSLYEKARAELYKSSRIHPIGPYGTATRKPADLPAIDVLNFIREHNPANLSQGELEKFIKYIEQTHNPYNLTPVSMLYGVQPPPYTFGVRDWDTSKYDDFFSRLESGGYITKELAQEAKTLGAELRRQFPGKNRFNSTEGYYIEFLEGVAGFDPSKPWNERIVHSLNAGAGGFLALFGGRAAQMLELETQQGNVGTTGFERDVYGAAETAGSLALPVPGAGLAGKAVEKFAGALGKVLGKGAAEAIEAAVRGADDVVLGAGKVTKYFDDIHLKTEPNKAYFWSGKSNGAGGAENAAIIASRNGGVTLETTLERQGIKMPEFDINDPTAVKAWQNASAAYARRVSGEVRAIIGTNINPNGVWNTIELPILKSNPNVTKIILIDPESLAETIIYTR